VCCQLDLLVPPLRGTVVAGDQPHPVQTAKVAVHKRMTRLRLLVRAVGEAEVPRGVLLPGVRLQERVLLPCARLHLLPTRTEHVLARVDQSLRVPDRVVVDGVGGHARILADSRVRENALLARDADCAAAADLMHLAIAEKWLRQLLDSAERPGRTVEPPATS
jgi:hypothetical protein